MVTREVIYRELFAVNLVHSAARIHFDEVFNDMVAVVVKEVLFVDEVFALTIGFEFLPPVQRRIDVNEHIDESAVLSVNRTT